MEDFIIGLDIGASLTKIVLVNERLEIIRRMVLPSMDPRETALRALNNLFSTIDSEDRAKVRMTLSTGGRSRFLGNEILGIPIMRVDEIKAIGFGGLTLSGRNNCLVVSAGTGTALVAVYDGGRAIRHVGGTGVGGGTILGLSRRMIGVYDFKVLEEMALRGDPSKVDLTINDIVGGSIGILPANVTASNFGKILGEASAEDVVAGIFNMVSQTIAVVAVMAAKAYNLEDNVVVTGMLAKSRLISRIIRETTDLFSVNVIIPDNCELAGAIGAIAVYLKEKGESDSKI